MKIINKYMAANRVLILGESGMGKSTSMRTLDPKETFIINVLGKPLPFKGWRAKYTAWTRENPMGNLYTSSKASEILACMDYINSKRPEIKNIVIEDLIYIMSLELFDRAKETGYAKFTDAAVNIKNVAERPKNYREDLILFYITHPDTTTDIEGNKVIKSKMGGRMIESQLNFEGLFDKVLYCRPRKTKDKGLEFGFETKTDGITPTKTPMEMFEDSFIPNDLQLVRDAILEYEGATV